LTIATDREREQNAYRLLFDYVHAQRPRRRLFIVHRLDRDTSGLIVFAKSERAKRRLQAQFEARDVERIYVAVVEGRVSQEEGTLESRLTEDRDLRVRPGRTGKVAITRYRVRERRRDRTILDLHLGTGRRHQIRVQLAAMGHPIIGDVAHGSRARRHDRLCLHASGLGFTHPQSSARVHFESAPPAGWV
jgi:23S rRNA pseudouridine1911/1915/1917 synthase